MHHKVVQHGHAVGDVDRSTTIHHQGYRARLVGITRKDNEVDVPGLTLWGVWWWQHEISWDCGCSPVVRRSWRVCWLPVAIARMTVLSSGCSLGVMWKCFAVMGNVALFSWQRQQVRFSWLLRGRLVPPVPCCPPFCTVPLQVAGPSLVARGPWLHSTNTDDGGNQLRQPDAISMIHIYVLRNQ